MAAYPARSDFCGVITPLAARVVSRESLRIVNRSSLLVIREPKQINTLVINCLENMPLVVKRLSKMFL